jgi:hypothetical protein
MSEYIVLSANTSQDLGTLVTHHMNNGWWPVGGVSVVTNGFQTMFVQAISRFLGETK